MVVGRFRRNVVGPPEWEREAMGSVVWVQCINLCRVCVLNLSIAASSVMGTVRSRSHYRVLVEMEGKPEITKLINKYVIKKCGDLNYGIVVRSQGDVLL